MKILNNRFYVWGIPPSPHQIMQERYEKLKEKNMEILDQHCEDCHCRGCENHLGLCLEKSLGVTLETFNNLLCRQCLVHIKILSF